MESEKRGTWSAVAAAVLVAVGILAGGWSVGRGMATFKGDVRSVTVKGLVERDVDADEATWTLAFSRASDSLREAHSALTSDRDEIVSFLHSRGFPDAEIQVQPASSIDRLAQDVREQRPRLRYWVGSSIVVKTADIARIQGAVGATDQLLAKGIVLDAAPQGRANPHYALTSFNNLRPQLLAEATRNARSIASQFASDSGARVGSIRTANQGNIQIFGSDGNDESASWSPTSTPRKKLRVVSTFEFELN